MKFLSTLSLRRATTRSKRINRDIAFLSTLSLRRATFFFVVSYSLPALFLSTLSLRRATNQRKIDQKRSSNFYPRSPCGERRGWTLNINGPMKISIHALLAESDDVIAVITEAQSISIHALLAESDRFFACSNITPLIFLSTLSLRRATMDGATSSMPETYFYPRSPCGERPGAALLPRLTLVFLSTLSLRRATTAVVGWGGAGRYFYPRSPCGERP